MPQDPGVSHRRAPYAQSSSHNQQPTVDLSTLRYNLWGGDGKLGNFLSLNDRVLLRRYFQSLLMTMLLPALGRQIADLNGIVNEWKKGVWSLVKSFWRKPKDESSVGGVESWIRGADQGGGDGGGEGGRQVQV